MSSFSGTACYALTGFAFAGAACYGIEPSEVLLFTKGSYSLRPQFSVSETFNDNIKYDESGKDADFITVISPGFILQLGTEEYNFINFSYYYDRVIYAQEDQLSANQHRLALGNHVQFNRLTLTGRDQIEFLSGVLGGGISLAGVKVDRTTFLDEYRLSYDFTEKTGVYIEGTHNFTDYDRGLNLFDSQTLIGTGGFEYRAFSRTAFFGEIYYGRTWIEPNSDALPDAPSAEFIGGFLGARGSFTEKLTGTVKAGVESREFSDGTPGDTIPVVEANLTERFTEKTILSLNYSRRQRVSVQFSRNAYTTDSVTLLLQQHIGNEGRMRAEVRAGYIFADYEPHPNYVEVNNGVTRPVDRRDHIFNVGAALTYDFKIWLHGNLAYDYERLDSNLARIVNYDVNRVTVGLSVGY